MSADNDVMSDKTIKNKQNKDWDCRALSEKYLDRFLSETSEKDISPAKIGLKAFADLVKKHPELSFCLRGNEYTKQNPLSGGKVCIYENNHAMFVLRPQSLQINPNYLRYCDDWKARLHDLIKDYNFNKGEEKFPNVSKTEKKDGTLSYSCSFSSMISVEYSTALLEDLEKLYDQMQEIFVKFFDPDCNRDRFLEWAQEKGSVPTGYVGKEKPRPLEKIRQQQLYKQVRSQKDGYFFYDMEFQQKHKSKKDQEKDKENGLSNKPDMQAIRFDESGTPAAWVFVEVKCTEAAYDGDSGLEKHIKSMREYIGEDNEECLDRRRREAFLLFNQYQSLGFFNLDRQFVWDDFKNLKAEILLVFTDEAIERWNSDKEKPEKWTEKNPVPLPDQTQAVLVSLQ